MFTRLKLELFHMAGSITLLNWFTELFRSMVPASSYQMTSLPGSEFKTEEDQININIVATLLFLMPAHYLLIWKHV